MRTIKLLLILLSLLWSVPVLAGTGALSPAATPPVRLNELLACEDQTNGVCKVEQRFSFINIVLAAPTTTVIKSGAGFLHLITVNKSAGTGVITCYDNTAGSGTTIATITSPVTLVESQFTLTYDVSFGTGLTCVTSTAAQDITVSYR
jgi:hypothetical protein